MRLSSCAVEFELYFYEKIHNDGHRSVGTSIRRGGSTLFQLTEDGMQAVEVPHKTGIADLVGHCMVVGCVNVGKKERNG